MVDWYSVETSDEQERLVAAWPDAPIENLELCGLILETAQEQVLAYAPTLEQEVTVIDGYVTYTVTIPDRYVYAQLQQATNLWNASSVSSDSDLGGDGYTFTPRPLDKTIRSIIRPQDVKPDVY